MAKNTTYDIVKAFEAIENELMSSMIRNMRDHKIDEIDEKKQWTMWQAEQLKSLEQYRRTNQERFGKDFKQINDNIELLIRLAKDEGEMEQEIEILKAIKKGFKAHKVSQGASAEFFKLNERKLDALIKATVEDMQKAETAILRMADDQYRKIIYNAQVYANTGAGTYEKAVDMATKDMLAAGLNCVEYANGARHTLKDYANMAIRTASKRAYLQGEGTKRQEWGIATVIVNKRGNPCPKCLPFCGKVLMDDVWSGGEAYYHGKQRNQKPKEGLSPVTGSKYPLMSDAVAAGLYHPRCEDIHTTYFEGISTPPDNKYTKQELNEIAENYRNQQKQQYAKRQEEKFNRLATYSLDEDNVRKYHSKKKQWRNIANSYKTGDDYDGKMSQAASAILNETDIVAQMNKIDSLIDDYLDISSQWSGNVIIDDTLKAYGRANRRTRDITIRSDTPIKSKIHELLHCRTDYDGISKTTNFTNACMNEAAIELMAEIICEENGITYEPTYIEQVSSLKKILLLLGDDRIKFAKKLVELPFTQRYNWIEEQVYTKMDRDNVNAVIQAEVMECLNVLYGRTWK